MITNQLTSAWQRKTHDVQTYSYELNSFLQAQHEMV